MVVSAVAISDEVLKPLEQLGMPAQKRRGQLDQLQSTDHLLVEEDETSKEVVVHFRISQGLPDFVKEGIFIKWAKLSSLCERDVA